MAKFTTKVVKTTKGTTKTMKDTSQLSGRQQIKKTKIENAGKNARTKMVLGTGAEAAGTIASTVGSGVISKHTAEVQKEQARQQTYQAAINKWNGILKSTPNEADGTNPGMEGTSNKQGSNNNTGSNPDMLGW